MRSGARRRGSAHDADAAIEVLPLRAHTAVPSYDSAVAAHPFALPDTVRILLVEDDPLLRTALSTALTGDWSRIVGVAESAAQAMDIAADTPFDVLLSDLDLGAGPTGAVLAHARRRERPSLGIVVLTSYSDPRLVGTKLSQLPPGTDYVMKQSIHDLDVLRSAVVRAALRGSAPNLPDQTLERQPLTDTHIETMRLIAEGLSNAEIAERRFVTEKSVEVTVSRILKQLGIEADRSRNARVEIARTYYAMAGSGASASARPTSPPRARRWTLGDLPKRLWDCAAAARRSDPYPGNRRPG